MLGAASSDLPSALRSPLNGKRTKTILPPRARSLSTSALVSAKRASKAVVHLFPEGFRRDKARRRRRGEEPSPAMLHPLLQFSWPRALFDHAGAALAIERGKIWRQQGRHLGVRAGSESAISQEARRASGRPASCRRTISRDKSRDRDSRVGQRLGVRSAHRFFRHDSSAANPAARKTVAGQRCR